MLNEVFILQCFSFIVLLFFIHAINILTLWYLAGFILLTLGLLLLNDNGGIFVGFLWIIDLGVGLIFFIFILHFSNFLHQKASVDVFNKYFFFFFFFFVYVLIFFYFLANTNTINVTAHNHTTWFFFINWYDYYESINGVVISDLNLLREIYFYNNAFGFFVINFMLLYGLFLTIILTFLIKKIFTYLAFAQIKSLNLLNEVNSYFFIRNQNFLKQQNASVGVRVWIKKKYAIRHDF